MQEKKPILHHQTLFYLFYQFILQLTLYSSFYFNIQPNKIIKKYCSLSFFSTYFSLYTQPHINFFFSITVAYMQLQIFLSLQTQME